MQEHRATPSDSYAMPKDHVTRYYFRDGGHRLFEPEMWVKEWCRPKPTEPLTEWGDTRKVRSRDV